MHPETRRREYVSSIHRELEIERDWYKHGLSKIIDMIVWNKYLNDSEKLVEAKSIVMSYLDGEPTTADEHNTMQEDEKLIFEEQFGGDTGTDADYNKEEE